jgi:hypothetical protein
LVFVSSSFEGVMSVVAVEKSGIATGGVTAASTGSSATGAGLTGSGSGGEISLGSTTDLASSQGGWGCGTGAEVGGAFFGMGVGANMLAQLFGGGPVEMGLLFVVSGPLAAEAIFAPDGASPSIEVFSTLVASLTWADAFQAGDSSVGTEILSA